MGNEMVGKVLSVYREKGFLGTAVVIVNFILGRLLGVRISKYRSIAGNKVAKAVFKDRSLKKTDKGYSCVDPMPTAEELSVYYSSVYWGSRSSKNYGVSARDLTHYHMLKNLIPYFFDDNNKVIVNFGAGHGGISNLFWFDGFDVVNVEPSGMSDFYSVRWENVDSIEGIQDGVVNMIYGSHSLEHVGDIDVFKGQVRRILRPNAFLFWEVPNAKNPRNGAMNDRIDIPHTYYFSADFFDDWFDEIILNEGFDKVVDVVDGWEDCKNSSGQVVRALGRIG